ncbi:MAG: glycosyltransferase family 39 protein [Nanoarchaeota archaeon]|nr:glycosyltransferase family 39 protein [Nanoarchaeota archaeon]MBU1029785.1 glycosyltransferase family 39 protein [Nanoarchaeota archaeon]
MIKKDFLKDSYWIILIAILILGFFLRNYHVDYPVIGYHNQKEAHTLSEIKNFYERGDYFVPERDYYKPAKDKPYGIHADNFPLMAWIVTLVWKLSGVSLVSARTIIILFSLGAILFTYLLVEEMFKRKDFAIISAFFVSIMPVLVFFGRQVQYESPALFFMMGALYFFWKWKNEPETIYFVLFSFMFILGGVSKYPFLVFIVPILAVFPYERLNFKKKDFKEKYLTQYLLGATSVIIFIGWWLFSKTLNVTGKGVTIQPFMSSRLGLLFQSSMWNAIYLYAVTDNFTKIGFFLALIGLIIVIAKIKMENHRFLAFWFFSYILFAAIAPPQMKGHNYYQVPYAPLIAILITYFIFFVGDSIASFIKQKNLKVVVRIIVIVLFVVWMYPQLKLSITRQFDTQFFGLDVAGEYIKNNGDESSWIFGSGHQDTGITWHSERKLFESASNVSDFKKWDEELNLEWVFIYQWGFQNILGNKELADYILSQYSLKQIGLQPTQNGNQPIYFLLQKGGSFNISDINNMVKDKPLLQKTYEQTSGNPKMFYINLD